MRRSIDLNADLGEGFGAWQMGHDDRLITMVTSANLACGFHAGDPAIMQKNVAKAAALGVNVGAHPGAPDLAGFGRRPMAADPHEVANWVLYQLGAMSAFTRAAGIGLAHVKLHGYLYNQAYHDADLARAVARAVKSFEPGLRVFCPPGSAMLVEASAAGLPVAKEAFVDRAYLADGTLAPRALAGAVITEAAEVAARAVSLVRDGRIATLDGAWLDLEPDTLCLHGDTPGAVAVAAAVGRALGEAGVQVRPL
ncbi:MAG: 5-oxoprolinase subunit PxpA [Bacillota bacterium]